MNEQARLILSTGLCPGDVLTLTAAVESLHRCHPEKYLTDVRTCARELWDHNPRITPIEDGTEDRRVEVNYPSVNRSNQESQPFLAGYMEDLAKQLNIEITLKVNRPQLYLSDEEKGWINQVEHHITQGRKTPFMVLNAGIKPCYPAKAWPTEYYEAVVRETSGSIQWVQIGAEDPNHEHPVIPGAINLIGKTGHRQLVRLIYHSIGGLGPITYLQHLCAAWEKPYICLVGGREPVTWCQYPLQHTLHTMGMLPCCEKKACWKSKVEINQEEDRGSLCDRPIYGMSRVVPQCMAMITPDDVIPLVRRITSC